MVNKQFIYKHERDIQTHTKRYIYKTHRICADKEFPRSLAQQLYINISAWRYLGAVRQAGPAKTITWINNCRVALTSWMELHTAFIKPPQHNGMLMYITTHCTSRCSTLSFHSAQMYCITGCNMAYHSTGHSARISMVSHNSTHGSPKTRHGLEKSDQNTYNYSAMEFHQDINSEL